MVGKFIILGVAAIWDKRKGLYDFITLGERLSEDYQIVLVGLEKDQISNLPDRIIGISYTNSVHELAELYSIVDYFVNPTYEDNYPTTNLEAIACGTQVITYDTGGSPESAELYGVSVPKGDLKSTISCIEKIGFIQSTEIDIDYKNTVNKYGELYKRI